MYMLRVVLLFHHILVYNRHIIPHHSTSLRGQRRSLTTSNRKKNDILSVYLVAVFRGYHAIIYPNIQNIPRLPSARTSAVLTALVLLPFPALRISLPRLSQFHANVLSLFLRPQVIATRLITCVSYFPTPRRELCSNQSCYRSLHPHVLRPPHYHHE